MSDEPLSLLFTRACELAIARGDVPDDGSGVDGVWTDEFPDVDHDTTWFVALNAEDADEEYPVTDRTTVKISAFRAHFWYDRDQAIPAAIGNPYGGEQLHHGGEFDRPVEDQIIASIETVLVELGELDEPVVADAAQIETDGGADIERPDPEDDPFACSICGGPLGELDRVEGRDYCGSCRREYGAECHTEAPTRSDWRGVDS